MTGKTNNFSHQANSGSLFDVLSLRSFVTSRPSSEGQSNLKVRTGGQKSFVTISSRGWSMPYPGNRTRRSHPACASLAGIPLKGPHRFRLFCLDALIASFSESAVMQIVGQPRVKFHTT